MGIFYDFIFLFIEEYLRDWNVYVRIYIWISGGREVYFFYVVLGICVV